MTETYDTTEDTANPLPYGCLSGRAIEAIDHGGGYFYIFLYLDDNGEIVYAYGDTNAWTTETITGPASVLNYDAAAILNISLAIDHNNDEVHIAFVSDDKIYHSKCTNPDAPDIGGNWQTYGANKYQRIDKGSHGDKLTVTICVDDSGGIANGNDDPHIAWSEDHSGTPHVHYNWGNGANDAFTTGSEVTIGNGTAPTITNIHDEGRRLYLAFVDSTGTRVDCIRHIVAATPLTLANWTGPVTGSAGTADPVLNLVAGHSEMTFPNITWYWDTNEAVLFTAMSEGFGGATTPKSNIFRDTTGTLNGEHNIAGYTGAALYVTCTQVVASDFRVFVQTDISIWHAREAADVANDYEWDANSAWYLLSDTGAHPVPMNAEWKGLEHADGALGYRRTHCLWDKLGTDLYFSEARENTFIVNSQFTPVDGSSEDESGNIDLVWNNVDIESDGQFQRSIQVDDDAAFGSPVVNVNWASSASTTYTIAGATLAAQKTYYWRIRTRDGEKGDEQDPYSDEPWSTDLRYFTTRNNVDVEIDSVTQQSDGDVYIDMRLISGHSGNAELDDGGSDFAQYRTTGGGWTNLDVIVGESTSDPVGPLTTTPNPGTFYRLAWNADADEASYEGLVDIRIRAEYDADALGFGYSAWVEFIGATLDTKDPVVALGYPDTETIVDRYPTLTSSGSDYSGLEYSFEIDDDVGFGSPEQSGYQDESSYQVVGALSAGTWYIRVRGRDKSVSQNESAWDSGSFTVQEGTFEGTVLSDGSTDVTLRMTSEVNYTILNALIEYENIENDYEEGEVNQNIVEYRGREPLEIIMSLIFTTGFETTTDLKQLFDWMKNETKLRLEDVDGALVTFGDNTYEEYQPDRWIILSITQVFMNGTKTAISANVDLREVEPT